LVVALHWLQIEVQWWSGGAKTTSMPKEQRSPLPHLRAQWEENDPVPNPLKVRQGQPGFSTSPFLSLSLPPLLFLLVNPVVWVILCC
jgi:hypothetical protein